MEKIILFDLDGTIIDSTDAIVDTFYEVFSQKKFNFKENKDMIISLIGYPLDSMFSALGVKDDEVEDFVSAYREHYRKISVAQTFLLKNSIESLEIAKQLGRLGVVTTKTGRYSTPLLENLNIMHYFEELVGWEHVEKHKPHPEPIYKVLELMCVDKKDYDIWMIGDTKLDLISAKNAGVNSIGVLSGYGKREELEIYSKYVVDTTLEAMNILKNLKD